MNIDTSDWTNEDWGRHEQAVNDNVFRAREEVQRAFDALESRAETA